MSFYTEVGKSILKLIWNPRRSQVVKAILNKKSSTVAITISNFRLYCKANNNKKQLGTGIKNKHGDKWNRIEDPELTPHNYSHLIFNNGVGKTGCPHVEETRPLSLTLCKS
jgi:hypothetical protein